MVAERVDFFGSATTVRFPEILDNLGNVGIGEFNKLVRLVSVFVALVLLSGCTGNIRNPGPLVPSTCAWEDWGLFFVGEQFVVGPVDSKTNRFPTSFVIPLENIVVSKDFPVEKYKQRLYVMVVDAGRRAIILPTGMDLIFGRPVKRTFVDGYESYSRSIERRYSGGTYVRDIRPTKINSAGYAVWKRALSSSTG